MHTSPTIPATTVDNPPLHSVRLISALIEHFTGRLSYIDNDVQGLYPASLWFDVPELLVEETYDLYPGARKIRG